MSVNRPDPLALAGQRLQWLEERQQVLAKNIANANTPSYQPSDLASFAQHLQRAGGGGAGLVRTDQRHLASSGDGVTRERGKVERSPDGNGVALDVQAMKVAETDQAHALALNLHRSWVGMFRAALGRG
jgi:flagellar basal-body rod protein FlgB